MIVLGPRAAKVSWEVLRTLLPDAACLAFAEPGDEPGMLFPEEAASVRNAVDTRRREFALGRSCARAALAGLGVSAVAIPVEKNRAPRWPPGVVGSITHCAAFVGAIVARDDRVGGIGFDVEPAVPLDQELIESVCTPTEIAWARGVEPPRVADWPKIFFSAKESIHKCIAPISGAILEFHDIAVAFDVSRQRFSATLAKPRQGLPDVTRIRGRIALTDQHVLTTAYIERVMGG